MVDHYSGYELGRYAVNLNDRGNETGVLVISGKFDREFANLKLINPTGSAISVVEMNLEVSGGDDNQNDESRDITETAQVQIVHNSPYPSGGCIRRWSPCFRRCTISCKHRFG
ncbi:MAG: hypothetical protein ACJZ1R_09005 [Candidatus Neomarinimicrobiota bacterium]